MRVAPAVSVVAFAMSTACKKEPVKLDPQPTVRVVSGATSSASSTLGKDLSEPAAGERFAVKLERERCYGTCPSYTLEVDADGAVRFRGRAFVAVHGAATSRVDAAAVGELVARLDRSGFFRMAWKDPCELTTDNPTVTITFVHGGRKRAISHNHGNHCMPAVLSELEDEIDRVAGSAAWTKCEDRDWPNVSPEQARAFREVFEAGPGCAE